MGTVSDPVCMQQRIPVRRKRARGSHLAILLQSAHKKIKPSSKQTTIQQHSKLTMNKSALSTIFLALSANFSGVSAINNNLRGGATTTTSDRELATTFTLQECKDRDVGYNLFGGTVNGETMIVGKPELAYYGRCPSIQISGGADLDPVNDESDELETKFYLAAQDGNSFMITGQYFDMFTLTDIQAAMATADNARKSTTKLLYQNFGYYQYRFLVVLLQQPNSELQNDYLINCHFFLWQVLKEEGDDYLVRLPTNSHALRVVKPKLLTTDPTYETASKVGYLFTTWLFGLE
jgi:hypothetical protein